MDPEPFDSVTADCLEPNDIVMVGESFFTLTNVEDHGDAISAFTEEGDTLIFDPSERVDLYVYPAVEV